MKNTTQIMRRCHALALAGLIGAGTIVPAGTTLAVGPGETQSATVISPVGPGQSSTGSTGTTSGTGSTSGQSASTANPNAWKKANGVYQMPDGSAINNVLFRGIDVSRWQGDINWSQVAADDVSFVMLGTRSKGAVDPYFHRNIQQASAAGVKVGVYIYSLAMTPEMAVEEANFVLNLIHDYPVSYPVAFDMEDSTQGTLSKDELAAIANAFCGRISEAGYYPVIYANDNWLVNKLDMSKMNYPVWVARYSAKPAYQNPVMWQATSTGAVNGISGNVDIDFQFRDFTSVIPANTWRTINGQTYYYQNYAKQKNNWIQDDGAWYYMDGDGLVFKGWLNQSGKSYYLDDATGKMITGWKSDSGKWYYFGSSGALSKGWINDNGTWYYSNQEGVMQTGWLDEGGRRYFLEGNGAMAKGWTSQNGKWYYLDSLGALSRGWINDNGTWYYSNQEGVMQTGWLDEGGERYYLKGSGAMATGWREMDGAWYYFEGSGRMAKGVIDVGGLHYYMDPSTGRMAAGTTVDIGGVAYTADGSGVLSQVVQETGNETGDGQTGNVQTGNVRTQAPDGSQGGQAPQPSQNGVVSNQAPGSGQSVTGSSGGPGVVVTPIGTGQ
ncbi:GH25 family lysozyme [Enterocloster clostridioformis]|uniref:GH25 family lysozyme n=1 Tax=Enterocloster clostridioformis TaxID=1531 RepID=UPI0004203CB4|nr:GH25 family lysozyme [Enterocloster clostridioformis]